MHLVLVYNAQSGRGRGRAAATAAADHLRSSGHDVTSVQLSPALTQADLIERVRGAGALIAMGGDGTVSFVVGAAVAADVPIYHAPLGTENLFAREFQMRVDPEAIGRAVNAGRVRRIDLARCAGRQVLLVVSFGPDAGVIHRLARARRGAISHRAYAGPILAELRELAFTRHKVTVDGTALECAEPSIVIVANCRQYAGRLDPARDARMDDGLLDVVILPYRTRAGLVAWAPRLRFGPEALRKNILRLRGEHVRVEAIDGPLVGQIDGEAMQPTTLAPGEAPPVLADITIEPGVVPVLLP
ncbi:MAG: hypothetical protein IID31_06985 [Planctomycetes bacterium]|nr:hypothetical protein [Planctomycetota bacterium]